MPKVIQVIENSECIGNGKQESPYRRSIQYYDFEGRLIAWNWESMMNELQRNDRFTQTIYLSIKPRLKELEKILSKKGRER